MGKKLVFYTHYKAVMSIFFNILTHEKSFSFELALRKRSNNASFI